MNAFQRVRSLVSAISSRAEIALRGGLQFNGDRDMYAACGWARTVTPEQFRFTYERNEVAGRIIDTFPDDVWRGDSGELVEDEDPNVSTDFEESWVELDLRLRIWPTFKRAHKLANLGRYAIIVIGAPGALSDPLERASAEDLMYLTPYSEEEATIKSLETDITNPRFGKPLAYTLRRTTKLGSVVQSLSTEVHWTRVIHVAEGVLDDTLFAQPKLLRIWNRLFDLEKVVGAGAESYWLKSNPGIQFDIDKELNLENDEEEALEEQVDEYVHKQRRVLQTKGVTINTLESTPAPFDKQVDALLSLIAVGTGIPQRILMGSERGSLASDQDRKNWDKRINNMRKEFAGPFVVRQFVDRLIAIGALPEPMEYQVRWPEVDDISDDERADLAVKWARINQSNGTEVVTPDEIRDRILKLPPLEEINGATANDTSDTGATNDNVDTVAKRRQKVAARVKAAKRRFLRQLFIVRQSATSPASND